MPPDAFQEVPNLAGTLPKPLAGKAMGLPLPSTTPWLTRTLYTAGEMKSGSVVTGISKILVYLQGIDSPFLFLNKNRTML